MADRVQYLEYSVYLDSKELAANYQAAYPLGVRIAPDALAALLGIPVVLHSLTTPFFAPSIRSAYFTATSKYPRNVAEFTICRGGWFGICALFGRETRYKWVAKYEWTAPPEPEVEGVPVPVPPPIQTRTWCDGFERETTAPAGPWNGGNSMPVSRAASRHTDGFGLAMRQLDDGGEYVSHTLTENGGAARLTSWERFYIRVRRAPTVSSPLWRCYSSSFNNAGADIEVTPGLQISVYNKTNVGVRTLVATSTAVLTLNEWAKLDVVLEFGAGRIRVFKKGVAIIDVTVAAGVGLGQATNHTGSAIGNITEGALADLEADIDDWICAEKPAVFTGLDWLNGSRVVGINPTGFAAGNDWAGDWRGLLRNPAGAAPGAATYGYLTNAVAGSTLRVTTDAEYTVNKCPGSLGMIALTIGVTRDGSADATAAVGYKFGAAAAVMTTVPEFNGQVYVEGVAVYQPVGLTEPNTAFTPLELHYTRGVSGAARNVYRFMASAEVIGTFGTEDVIEEAVGAVTSNAPARLGLHNAPYPRSVWGRLQIPPTAPVIVFGGTYTGNGTGQDLTFRAPVNFFYSRGIATSGMEGSFWWSSLQSSHYNYGFDYAHSPMIQAAEDVSFVPIGGVNDPEERYIMRIVGSHAAWNQNTRVYQFIAVIDPGARFMLNGQEMHNAGVAIVDALKDAGFTPLSMFIHSEAITGGGSGFGFKGSGNAATGIHRPNTAETASFLTFGTGSITIGTNGQLPEGVFQGYSAWRIDDGSGDPNIHKVVKMGSYVGNGAASRTISFAPASGLRPLWAMVGAVAADHWVMRDPSHTGTTSSQTNGSLNAATGITSGGLDEMTVGLMLNANGVTYNYFVFLGGTVACNNGWSCNGEFIYVEPEYRGPDLEEPPEPVDPEPPEPPEPEPPEDPDCEAGEVCVAATTREVNRALVEIGSTKFLTNYCTQQTLEAQTARLLYDSSVQAVLHAFPWPFATRYAVLALVAAQPSNQDWAFAYRQPTNCIFERRISVARATGVDPTPPPFELSSDTAGGLILTNEPNAVLEYTIRPSCVAFTGDALFKETLVWHLAAKLAPPLTRMTEKAKFCMEQYDLCIAKAHAIIRPDDPGLRVTPTWQAQDVGAGAMAANVEVANIALINLGARTIASLAPDQSREGKAVNLVFEQELRATLRDYPWKFAKRYSSALVLVDGTATVPANIDWQYSYRLPADYVSVRRLATEGTGRSFERRPKTFEVGTDVTGNLLFTGEDAPNLEYTARIANAVLRSDALFREALAWRLVAALAPSLAQPDPEVHEQQGRGPESLSDNVQKIGLKPSKSAARERAQRWAFGQYLRAIEKARIADANEAEPEPSGDAEWIEGRN